MSGLRNFIVLCVLALPILASAQQVGVLLGIAGASTKEPDWEDEPQYQTLWIAPDAAGQPKVLAALPELIVPRRDGFWHVGVKQVCEFSETISGGNESLGQLLWAAPVMQAGLVEQSTPCTPHNENDYAPPFPRGPTDENKISQCGFELVNVEYVSPELISIRIYNSQSEDCDPRGGRYNESFRVRKFESDNQVSFGQLLGPTAHEAYMRALPEHATASIDEDCGEPDRNDTGWKIEHVKGHPRAHLHQDLGYFGCAVDKPLNVPLPSSLTGDARANVDWRVLSSRIKGLQDVYISPAHDWIIAVTETGAGLYEFQRGAPGKLLLKLPAGDIVMAQVKQLCQHP